MATAKVNIKSTIEAFTALKFEIMNPKETKQLGVKRVVELGH